LIRILRGKATKSFSDQPSFKLILRGVQKFLSDQLPSSRDAPWYEPFTISFSIGAILLWFCVMREENDIDKKIGNIMDPERVYQKVDGLEKKQIEIYLDRGYAKSPAEVDALYKRLDELDSQKK